MTFKYLSKISDKLLLNIGTALFFYNYHTENGTTCGKYRLLSKTLDEERTL